MSDKPTKKLKARLPRGLADHGPAELSATRGMIEKIRAVYETYGFEGMETPAIEYTDVLGKFLPDQDRPNEGVFSFQDDDKQWLSLRYDLTAPLARYVAENIYTLPRPYRSYRYGWVFRNEKPGPGRYRQFMQFDADTVGAASVAADAEMCMMAADTMEALGIKRGDYVIKVNNRKLLDGVMDAAKIKPEQRLTVLRAIDKLDRLGEENVRALLGKGRKDESGDLTKGANLTEDQIHDVMTLLRSNPDLEDTNSLSDWELKDSIFSGGKLLIVPNLQTQYMTFQTSAEPGPGRLPITNRATIKKLRGHFWGSDKIEEGLDELEQMADLFQASEYGSKRILVDPSIVRGLEYYTGPVYEADLTFETKDEKGNLVRFGSVGGGGRYDRLIARFRGEPVPATGFSIGVSRLLAALQTLGKVGLEANVGPVIVTVFDRNYLADYIRFVKQLRNATLNPQNPDGPKIRAELYLGNPKSLPNQLKYASQRNAPCAVIQGPDEKNDPSGPQVIIKDLIVGAEIGKFEEYRDEYLQKQTSAQLRVPQDQLVQAVRQVLIRHRKHGH